MKITDVLDQIGTDVLSEDTKTLLIDAFNEAVEQSATDRLEIEVKSALEMLDEEHTTQLSQLLEAIDRDHTHKLTEVLQKLDEDHTEKLQYLIKKNQNLIKEDAGSFKKQLVKQLSNYLDLYLEDAIPKREIAEAVSNRQAQRTLDEIKSLVAIDEEYVNDTIREAVADGKKTIDALKTELNEAVKQNIKLNQEVKTTKSSLILEGVTKNFEKTKKNYVMRVLSGKDPDYITENFDYVVKMFEKDENENQHILAEDAKKKTKVMTNKVDMPKKDVELIQESADQNEGAVSEYLQSLKQQDRSHRG